MQLSRSAAKRRESLRIDANFAFIVQRQWVLLPLQLGDRRQFATMNMARFRLVSAVLRRTPPRCTVSIEGRCWRREGRRKRRGRQHARILTRMKRKRYVMCSHVTAGTKSGKLWASTAYGWKRTALCVVSCLGTNHGAGQQPQGGAPRASRGIGQGGSRR